MSPTSNNNGGDVQSQLEAPIPWIGMYVAAASLVCSLAMTADVFHGFRTKKLWFPSKYFSINATTLSLLPVAMKLPVDLTTHMWAVTDRLAKVSSLILVSTAMGNFMTSFGSMNDKEILLNVTALGILVITVIVNVCIQIIQTRHFLGTREMYAEEIIASFSIVLLFVMLSASAIMVPTAKRHLEMKYQENLKLASEEELEQSVEFENLTTDKVRTMIRKYWVMAETSSPQFVIARSVTCSTSGVICLLIAFILAEAQARMAIKGKTLSETASNYAWSTGWIVLAQSAGVVVGTIAPAFRWLTAVNFAYSEKGLMSYKDAFKIETYWIQMLVEWKERSLPLETGDRKLRKFLHGAKGLILSFAIRVQMSIVLSSKLVQLICVCFMGRIILCFHCITSLKNKSTSSTSDIHGVSESESGVNTEQDLTILTRYVLLLEGEVAQPPKTLKNICNKVDKVIEMGKKKQPKNLETLLLKANNFSSWTEMYDYQVPSLHSQEPPNCWSLHLVILTTIAIALPSIPIQSTRWLLTSVNEGLFYVKLIEKILDRNGVRLNIRNAADAMWADTELYKNFQHKDLDEMSRKGRNSKAVLQEFSDLAEKTVMEFKTNVKDCRINNPLNWPVKVISANSMYQITRTILLLHESEDPLMDEGLFNQISTKIADLLAACLTNLTRIITMKCHQNSIEEREKSVYEAALLLGQTEEILHILQQRKGQSLNLRNQHILTSGMEIRIAEV